MSFFVRWLDYVINKLNPTTIIVYGSTPDAIFSHYRDVGIAVMQFDSDYASAHKKAVGA